MTRKEYNERVNRMMERYGDEIEQLIIDLELIPVAIIPKSELKEFCQKIVLSSKDKEFEEPNKLTICYLRDAKKRAKERKKKLEKEFLKITLFNR